jgi:hypothetical protein
MTCNSARGEVSAAPLTAMLDWRDRLKTRPSRYSRTSLKMKISGFEFGVCSLSVELGDPVDPLGFAPLSCALGI